MDGDGSVAEHRLGTGGSDDDLLVRSFDVVGEAGDDSKLELLVDGVAGDVEERSPLELLLVDLEIAKERVKSTSQ